MLIAQTTTRSKIEELYLRDYAEHWSNFVKERERQIIHEGKRQGRFAVVFVRKFADENSGGGNRAQHEFFS